MAHSIAIIEDDLPISDLYRLKFESAGFTVKTAPNGVAGLKLLKDFHPDVILLDVMMPEMNGDEMLEQLRRTDYGKDAKVFLFTNIGPEEVPPTFEKLNIQDVILKAYHTPTQVVEQIQKALAETSSKES